MLKYVDGVVKDLNAPKRKIKIGEIVKIKPLKLVRDLLRGGIDFPFGFVDGMLKYCGKTAKVIGNEEILYSGEKMQYFRLNIDNQMFGWSVDMFDWSRRSKSKTIMETE